MTAGGHLADPAVELHLVTGKGGTGKTTVAAALALSLASQGRTVLLVEVEGRQGLAQLFELPPLPYAETPVGDAGLHLLAVDAKEALREYLQMYYRLGPAMGLLDRFGAVDFVTTIAPGLRDVLLTGKMYEAVGDRRRGRRRYDAVVVDAPPTGRIGRFLNINAEVSDLAKMGPVHSQATSIMSLMASPRTAIHLVTLAEEMPVTETLDGIAELTAAGLRVGVIVANRIRTSPLDTDETVRIGEGRLPASRVTTGLRAAGLDSPELPAAQLSVALLGEADDLLHRLALQTEQMQRLTDSGRPVVQLPELAEGGTLDGVGRLAGLLAGSAGS